MKAVHMGQKSYLRLRALRLSRSARSHPFSAYVTTLVLVFLLLSLFRLSTASLPFSSDGTDDARILVNEVRMTRSDDFLRGIPRWISYERGGIPDSILDYSNSEDFLQATRGSAGTFVDTFVLLPDEVFVKVLSVISPLEMKFSMREWGVYLRVFVVVPAFFVLLNLPLSLGITMAGILSLTPLSLWFGGSTAVMVSSVLLVCVLFLLLVRISKSSIRFKKTCYVLVALYLGQYSIFAMDYPPWKWPVVLVFGSFTLVWLVHTLDRRWLAQILATGLGAIAVVQLVRWMTFKDQYSQTLDTVYPGKRRSSGGGVWGNPLDGAITWFMQTERSKTLQLVNPENARTLNVLIFAALIYTLSWWVSTHRKDLKYAVGTSLLALALVVLWISVSWPAPLLKYNPLTYVPTERASQIVGVIAILLLGLIIGMRTTDMARVSLAASVGTGLMVFVVSVPATVRWAQDYYGGYGSELAWWSCFALGAAVMLYGLIRRPTLALLPLLVFTFLSSFRIQPVTVGLGPLVNSPLAQAIRDTSKVDSNALWASDPFWSDALTMAQGVKMLTGQQPLGPNKDLWRILDPTDKYVDNWNRGQSYIHVTWDINRADIVMANNNPDIINVSMSPCNPVLKELGLRYIVTGSNPGTCMRKLSDHTWMARPVAIYEVAL